MPHPRTSPLRVDRLRFGNYRALRDVEFTELAPLTVMLGPNGSGKSTVLDAVAFLHEAVTSGLEAAWNGRGRLREVRSRDSVGPIEIEIVYRDDLTSGRPVRYLLAIDEVAGAPVVVRELLQWFDSYDSTSSTTFLDFREGRGAARDDSGGAAGEEYVYPETLALTIFGQVERYGTVNRTFVTIRDWYLSLLAADGARDVSTAGPQRRLMPSGANLANVIQHLREKEPARLRAIVETLIRRVPQVASLDTEVLADDRLRILLRDAPFTTPISSRYISDGTLKLLAYLTLFSDPSLPGLIGVEEPENFLHPRLLYGLAEEMRQAADDSQLLVTTHSPYFVDALRPDELWVLYRKDDGYAQAVRASDLPQVMAQVDSGGRLGDLWMEGFFGVGDPLTRSGRPLNLADG